MEDYGDESLVDLIISDQSTEDVDQSPVTVTSDASVKQEVVDKMCASAQVHALEEEQEEKQEVDEEMEEEEANVKRMEEEQEDQKEVDEEMQEEKTSAKRLTAAHPVRPNGPDREMATMSKEDFDKLKEKFLSSRHLACLLARHLTSTR